MIEPSDAALHRSRLLVHASEALSATSTAAESGTAAGALLLAWEPASTRSTRGSNGCIGGCRGQDAATPRELLTHVAATMTGDCTDDVAMLAIHLPR